MFNFELSIPTGIHFGNGAVKNVGKLMHKHADTVLLLYGSDRIFREGLGEQIVADLEANGCSVVRCGGVQANADSELINYAIQVARENNVNGILAVGGGSVMDSAKAIAVGACCKNSITEVFRSGECMQCVLPIGVVVTMPATGSEANGVAVIQDHDSHEKITGVFPQSKPKFAILDPELTLNLPAYQTAAGGFDIISHAFERYFDASRESILLDQLALAAMKTVVAILPKLIEDPTNLDLRSEIMYAATLAHSDMIGPGGDFACHNLAHPITSLYGVPHGAALAMVIPSWCKVMYHHDPSRFDLFFKEVFGAEDTEDGQIQLRDFVQGIGLALGVSENLDPSEMTRLARDRRVPIGGGFRAMTDEEIEAVYAGLK